ncbi:MAG: hydrogenase maturation nickel metallochaperone HypA [Clostridia bacterium]|nr:hydrogenase maturation nickel metallochaperone HypA [Clostridia bacterium]
MHEMGLMDAVLRMVDRIRREQQLGPVRKITLEVGELSGVVPRFLEECYEAVAAGTPFEGTELALEIVPGLARCEDCRSEFRPAGDVLRCPACSGEKLTPIAGKDMTIKEIEVFDPEEQ